MEKSIVTTGKTIDLAIEAALSQLGLDRDSVSVQVLAQAKAGFLGFGASPAKVQVTYEAPDPVPEKPKSALGSASRSKPKAAPAPKAAPKAAAPAGASGAIKVTAPMPGNILSVNVQNGAAVKKGDVLMVLEAMKMENEIMSPCDGTVVSVNVQSGASVETGAVLCVIG